jgi:hypothetical protein
VASISFYAEGLAVLAVVPGALRNRSLQPQRSMAFKIIAGPVPE